MAVLLTLMLSVSLSPCASCMALSMAFSSAAPISPFRIVTAGGGTAGDDVVGEGNVSVDMLGCAETLRRRGGEKMRSRVRGNSPWWWSGGQAAFDD